MNRKVAALVVASTLLLTGCGVTVKSSSSHMNHNSKDMVEPGTAAAGGGSYLDEAIPADVLALKLFDQDGKTFTLGSLKGKYVVITNFLTSFINSKSQPLRSSQFMVLLASSPHEPSIPISSPAKMEGTPG